MKRGSKKARGLCATRNCTHKHEPQRNYCGTCRCRRSRAANPMYAAFKALRDNATRRHKEFTLTFEQFKQFAIEVDYIKRKGRSNRAYHIDRKDNNKGYTIDNIRVLTGLQNRRKYTKSLHYDYQTQTACHITNTGAGSAGPF